MILVATLQHLNEIFQYSKKCFRGGGSMYDSRMKVPIYAFSGRPV